MSAATPKKDTIYIDVDDEITSIIDKLEASKQSIVALVLPKRASTLQSIVNMRLLKRAADSSKKKIVLITNEAGILPLAGAAGVHVAKNLTSKPTIPTAPEATETDTDISDAELEAPADDQEIDTSKSVGELSGQPANEEDETIELEDDTTSDKAAAATPAGAAANAAKPKRGGKFKIPNFDKFRLLLALGILGVILLIGGTVMAVRVLPKASITIKTDSTDVTATLNVTTSDKIQKIDEKNNIVPASLQQQKQTESEKVPATGEKNLGEKATGTITITNCEDSNTRTLSAGTPFTRKGLNYFSTKAVTVPAGSFAGGGSVCTSSSAKVAVSAASAGEDYNQNDGSYTSSSPALEGNFDLEGTEMEGGTTKIAKVVSQQDIETAKQRIAQRLSGQQEKFQQELEDNGFYVLPETTTSSEPKITATPSVDQEASEVTVTQEITYAALTVDKDGLNALLMKALEKQIDTKKQKIAHKDVLNNATIRVGDKKSLTEVTIQLEKTDKAVPIFDKAALAAELEGKKKGEIENLLSSRPGVKEVEVEMSPFWVSKAPNADKITINDQPADGN